MTDVLPAAHEAAAIPSGRRHPVLLMGAIALCALLAGAAGAVVIYALVDEDAATTAPQPSIVVVPMHSTTAEEIAAAKAMDRYKNEAQTAVAISGESTEQVGAFSKDEAATAVAIGNGRAKAPTSSLAGIATPAPDESKIEAAAKGDTMQRLGDTP